MKNSYRVIGLIMTLVGLCSQANAQYEVEKFNVTGVGTFDGQPGMIKLVAIVESWSTYDYDTYSKTRAYEYEYRGTISHRTLSFGIFFSGTQLDKLLKGSISSQPDTFIKVYVEPPYMVIYLWDNPVEIGRFQLTFTKIQ